MSLQRRIERLEGRECPPAPIEFAMYDRAGRPLNAAARAASAPARGARFTIRIDRAARGGDEHDDGAT